MASETLQRPRKRLCKDLLVGDVTLELVVAQVIRLVLPMPVLQPAVVGRILEVEIEAGGRPAWEDGGDEPTGRVAGTRYRATVRIERVAGDSEVKGALELPHDAGSHGGAVMWAAL